jgi:hypothetical protein
LNRGGCLVFGRPFSIRFLAFLCCFNKTAVNAVGHSLQYMLVVADNQHANLLTLCPGQGYALQIPHSWTLHDAVVLFCTISCRKAETAEQICYLATEFYSMIQRVIA